MVINSFSLFLSWKVCLSLSILTVFLSVLDWISSSLGVSKTSVQILLAFKVCVEKSTIIPIGRPLYVMWSFIMISMAIHVMGAIVVQVL